MIKSVEIEKLIKIKTIKGTGKEKDPMRSVVQYWDFENNMLFEIDDYELTNCSASSAINS